MKPICVLRRVRRHLGRHGRRPLPSAVEGQWAEPKGAETLEAIRYSAALTWSPALPNVLSMPVNAFASGKR